MRKRTERTKMSIGIFVEDGDGWIAGLMYIYTIVHALNSIRNDHDHSFEIKALIQRQDKKSRHLKPLEALADSVHYYDTKDSRTSKKYLKKFFKCLLRLRPLPVSLKQVMEREIDILFPIRCPLKFKTRIPWIGWIPDFQHVRMPEHFTDNEFHDRNKMFQTLIDQSSHLVLSSKNAEEDMHTFFNANRSKVSIYSFCTFPDDSWFDQDVESVLRKYSIPGKYLFFPSQYWKHKDHLTLFRAIKRIKETGLDDIALILTGSKKDYRNPSYPGELDEYIRVNELEETILHLGLLDRVEQIQVMRAAAAVVQPSHFEGWSMLLEDCRALGKTIYLSDLPVHREQAYKHSKFFKKGSTDELTALLLEDWPMLRSGPCFERESKARNDQESIAAKNGETLMKCFKSVNAF